MARFEINGKEYELKLTFESVKYLNGLFEGGSFEVIGKAIMGDLNTFPHIIHAALFHTGENFALKDVEKAIDEAIQNEKLDLDGIVKLSNEIVANSFFYKKTVDKLLKENKEAKKAMEQLLK